MQDEFQCGQPFLGISFRVGKFGGELVDLIDDEASGGLFDVGRDRGLSPQ